ncbi:hypothetical protein SAMN02910263_03935, partial [Butyrivibrio sp. INlla16]
MSFHFAIVNTEKLISPSSHVDIVILTFRAFSVKELIYRIVSWFILKDSAHKLKKSLPEP